MVKTEPRDGNSNLKLPMMTHVENHQCDAAITRLVAPNPGAMTGGGTNTWIVGGPDKMIIDPGPDDAGHIHRILDAVKDAQTLVIVVTHGHLDHVGAALRLRDLTGASLAAMATERHAPVNGREALLPAGKTYRPIAPDIPLRSGQRLRVGAQDWEVLHLPGHTPDHLCLAHGTTLFTGDLILPKTPSIVAPPEGSIDHILQSLDVVAKGPWRVGMPGHDAVIDDLQIRAKDLQTHRQSRLAALRASLTSDWQPIDSLRQTLYPDVPSRLIDAARASIMAQLFYLEQMEWAEMDGSFPDFIARSIF